MSEALYCSVLQPPQEADQNPSLGTAMSLKVPKYPGSGYVSPSVPHSQ